MTDFQDWFWMATAAGQTFIELRYVAARSPDAAMKALATQSLVPRAIDIALKSAGSA